VADYNELFRSNDFRAFRKKQVELVAETIKRGVFLATSGKPEALAELKGQLSIVKEFLRLPEALTGDEKTLEILRHQLTEDVDDITRILIRKEVLDAE